MDDSTSSPDLLGAWAARRARRGDDGPLTLPLVEDRVQRGTQGPSRAPHEGGGTPATRYDGAGNVVVQLPDFPRALRRHYVDPYHQLLDEVEELVPDMTGGVRVDDFPDDSNLRGVPVGRQREWPDERVRAYIVDRYGPENAALVQSPFEKGTPGEASADEKARWTGR